jgi:hypothetical protein
MCLRERAMVTLSSSSKKSKSSESRMARAVRSSGGSLAQVLNAACAWRKISSTLLPVLQLLAEVFGVAFVGQRQLVAQVVEAVVDRGGRQHQHLGLHALLDDLVHQLLVARLLVLVGVVVAEVVRLVDDHEVVVAPVDPVQRCAERLAAGAAQVGVAQHVVVEAVLGEDVGLEVAVVVEPVVGQLLGAQHQHRLVAQLVVLDHGQRGEGLAQAHAVGQDAAAVGFQLVDDAGGGIFLES